jgi:hypothetical protein
VRQLCKVCGRPDKLEYRVPDQVWQRVVPSTLRNRVVCLTCFDDFAAMRRVNYATSIQLTLRFDGEAATLDLWVRQAVPSVYSKP